MRHLPAGARGVLATRARDQRDARWSQGTVDARRALAARVHAKVAGSGMKAVALPPSWHSRILILLAFVAAVSVAACSEKLEAGAACPVLCPVQGVELKDTVVEAVAMDSTLPVTPVIGEETSMLLPARGDTPDTRIIFRFDTIIQTYQHPSAPADTIITKVDSATLRIVLDTTTRPNVPGLPTVPVTLELYDVDYSASDTVAADLIPLFDSSRLLGSKTFAPESLSKDTLFIPVSNSAVLDKITNGTHLRLGMRLVSSASAPLRVLSKASVGALLRFKPAADTAITVSLISKTPADSTLATLREHLSDYVIVAKGIAPRPPLTIAAGGY